MTLRGDPTVQTGVVEVDGLLSFERLQTFALCQDRVVEEAAGLPLFNDNLFHH